MTVERTVVDTPAAALHQPDQRPTPSIAVHRPGRRNRRTLALHLAVFGGFLVLAVLIWWRVWITGDPSTTITCQCGDPSQELWFLTWTPWAIIHGHSPFLTNAIFAGQGGANMMVNTSWMLPSVVLAPITWLFGPIASFNVAATLAPAISGWSCFVAARAVTRWVPAQVAAGLLLGFSPFLLQNDPFGHLNFTLLFFPPLAFAVLYDLLVTHRHPPVRSGVALGALVIAEFFTSTELLAMTLVVFAGALVVAAVMAPRQAWAQRRRVATAAVVSGGMAVVVLAYPVWMVLAGPRRIVGFPWENSPQLGTAPNALVSAGVGVHDGSLFDRVGGYFGAIGPNAGPLHLPSLVYLGPLLVVFLLVSAVTWYRSRLAWTVVAGTLIAWVCSFGTTLGTEAAARGQLQHPWWLPWRLAAHLPLVADILPIRFGVLVTFGAALLLAISLDSWWARLTRALERHRPAVTTPSRYRRPAVVAGAIMTVVGLVVLAPIAAVDPVPFSVHSSALPAWFADDAPRLPAGTVVLVVPFAGQTAMGWQAQTGLRFALAGGFAVVPDPNGRSAFVDIPGGAVATLSRLSSDPESLLTTPLPASSADIDQVRQAIIRWGVGVTVVTHRGIQPLYSVAFLTAVYGRAPDYRGGTWVWTGPPGTSLRLPDGTLATCAATAETGASAVPACVLGAVGVGASSTAAATG